MEIPELSIDEIRKIFREMWIGSMTGSHGFIMQKLGPAALEELNNEGAKHCNPGYSDGVCKERDAFE